MQPKPERSAASKGQPPLLHLTPTKGSQKKSDSQQGPDSPWLLKPRHDIPPTPPPQADPKPFFQQRVG